MNLPINVPGGGNEKAARKAARLAMEGQQRVMAMAAASAGFILGLAQTAISSARSHKRYAPAVSTRSEAAIVSDLNRFYARRPRPWRWYGNSKPRGRIGSMSAPWRRAKKAA